MYTEKDPIMHYASKYYDPQKAHEYYERTKHLKGTSRSTSRLSEEGKRIWEVTKSNIATEKKKEEETEQNKHNQKVEATQKQADETRKRINQKLEDLAEKISAKNKQEKEAMTERTQAKIRQLMDKPIPKGISAEQRAKIIEQRNKAVASISNNTQQKKAKLDSGAAFDINSAQKVSNKEREKVANDLKGAVQKAREEYAKTRENINTKYEEESDREYEKIASSYRAASKKSTKN